MQFVITGFSVAGLKMAEKLLENFRFRQDVHVFPEKSIPLWEPILKAAYALLLPDPDSFTLVRACSSQVPVISIANGKEQAIPTEMAMIGDGESLGQMLMKIYKNETFRDELIREGIKKAAIDLELADTKTLWPKILNTLNEFSS
ncbi:MAG TPA: hypothetical protein VFV08_06380, partial [Puia sp.]|nr:hypothetical protein [Puia sp.]